MKNKIDQFLRYLGCVGGKEAFKGPRRAEVYLTNKCNLDCIACWSYSPLLKGRHLPPQIEIDWKQVERLFSGLAESGCREIHFVGGGEPMIYPKIMEALKLAKSLGMSTIITTNMSPVTEKRAVQMVEIGVDRLYASLWAATPQTYCTTHPRSSQKDFEKIDKTLRYFNKLKDGKRHSSPQIILYNVIFRQNHKEVRKMVDYAVEVGATAVQFTAVYTFPGSTDILLLDDSMRQEVKRQIDGIPNDIKKMSGHHGPGTFLWEIEDFTRRLEETEASQGDYDKSILKTLPCQIGWFYAIIQADGAVIPCCKGQSKPMGNIYERPFRDIWYGAPYDEFRHNAKFLEKNDPYFTEINCYKMCDNIGVLKTIEEHMKKLRPIEGLSKAVALPVVRRMKRK